MTIVTMIEAEANLARLVEAVANGSETEIVIARDGHPAARLVPVVAKPKGQRIGVAKGEFVMPESIDDDNDLIAEMFNGSR